MDVATGSRYTFGMEGERVMKWLLTISVLGLMIACDDETKPPADVIVIPDAEFDQHIAMDVEPGRDMNPSADAALSPDATNVSDAGVDAAAVQDMFIPPACNDQEDNDDDNLSDYPLDPGCSSLDDDSEADPELRACADGLDNDNDGLIDYPDDPGCAAADDVNESSVCRDDRLFRDITGLRDITGETQGVSELNICRNNNAPEALFLITIRDDIDKLRVDTRGSSFDTLLAVWTDCADPMTELNCNDDISFAERTSEVVVDAPAPGDYYILLDGLRDAQGEFQLTVRGELAQGRQCDSAGDETNWIGCGLGLRCVEDVCQPTQCSDGIDNNGDGRVDFPNDPGCTDASDDSEILDGPLPQCADGVDNDFDGRVDFGFDPDCRSAADDDERSPPACRDGVDNDGDGLVDLDDPGCQDDPDRFSEFNLAACRNGQDDDEDGRVDFPNDPAALTGMTLMRQIPIHCPHVQTASITMKMD